MEPVAQSRSNNRTCPHHANTLPRRDPDVDTAHMLTFFAHDYNDPTAVTRGHAMHNLTALMMLDAVWREVMHK